MAGGLLAAAVVALAGCASAGSTVPSCTTASCAAAEIQRSLVGLVAKDNAVMTKAVCAAAGVRQAGGTWTATCAVTESDGSVWRGYGSWVVATGDVAFEPVTQVKAAA